MVLPLYLAMTAAEISAAPSPTFPCAYMACHFSPYGAGLAGIPDVLPEKAMLILNDRMACAGHSPDLVAGQLADAVSRLSCESVLLDFQRPPEPESLAMAKTILKKLPCPAAVTEGFAQPLDCPVFLSPAPLHVPSEQHIAPWRGREIWLEAALCQEEVQITEKGMTHHPVFPTQQLAGGFYEEALRCCYRTKITGDSIDFTLFDTPESLEKKLELAAELGVSRAVGLWQELGTFSTGKSSA